MEDQIVLLVPVGLGALITVAIGFAKYFGLVPDGAGGKVSLVANVVIGAALYIAAGFGAEVAGETANTLYQILALVALLLAQFLTSLGAQKASKAAKIYTPKGNR
ncbi:hypothetical protein LCGC14_1850150 [marine sediment metagenome]|uniref:Uncharacterized protein n=1 Tax=marine sediment metagenome TaxID=412755 RepID=A0A0F9J9W4_9ZZZZ